MPKDDPDETSADDPTIVVEQQDEPAKKDALSSEHDAPDARAKVEEALEGVQGSSGDAGATPAGDAEDAADDSSIRERAGAAGAAAGEFASAQAAKAGEKASEAREKLGAKAGETREKAGAKAGEARERAAAFAASARERAASTDVKELAANTTSLIDTARPFFLAAFAVVFTILGFAEGDSGTSQWFVVGAILFVLAAGFSDELGHLMPRRRRVWASWNFLRWPRRGAALNDVAVTYWMNELQGIDKDKPLFVSLNPPFEPDPRLTFGRYLCEHPQYNAAAFAAQKRLEEIQGKRHTWFCGAWTGYGFHEDGLRSGLAVADALGAAVPWRAPPPELAQAAE